MPDDRTTRRIIVGSAVFEQDDYFKIDPEMHLIGDMTPLEHFPGVQMWWRAIGNIARPLILGLPEGTPAGVEPADLTKNADPDMLLAAMDRYGVDIGCLLTESMTDIENAIWELEYWVKERDARIFKFYPPEDTYINDPDLWPFYRKAEELRIVLDIHTGFSWVPPGKSKYALPIHLDDVARDFPELKIVAFHMGYPHCDDLNMVALGHPNVYPCLSLLVPWALSAPRKFARIIGEALRFVGPERIIWGTDCAGFGVQIAAAVQGLREFQIPEDMQKDYGYPAITDDDRRKIFGENLARLIGIDPKRRIANP
jgi:predicted TIM-barrel fold metal-dependent hydrolase